MNLMVEGEGGELGIVSLSESSRPIGGSSCMILWGVLDRGILLASEAERKKICIEKQVFPSQPFTCIIW
jgi:hypothetical protein